MAGARVLRSRGAGGQAVVCRPATLRDYEGIQALHTRYGLGERSYEAWSHIWTDNPVCRSMPELPIGWVLEDRQRRVVGSFGSIPFRFELNGRPLIVATSAGWVVDEQHRGYAPLLLDRFLTQPGIDLYLCVSPNDNAEPSIVLQCERVPVGAWDRVAFWVTNPWGFAASALAKRGVRFQSFLRHPTGAAVLLGDLLRRDPLKAAGGGRRDHDVRTDTAFDDRFDEFWETMRARHPHRLLNTHSREVLEWHFKYPFANGTAWVSSVHDGARIAAYAVFCRKDIPAIGLRRVRLLDFQSLDGGTSLLPPLLAREAERCRRDGTAVLENVGWCLEPGDAVARLAPYSRALPSWKYFYKAATPALADELKDRAAWNPTQFDGNECI